MKREYKVGDRLVWTKNIDKGQVITLTGEFGADGYRWLNETNGSKSSNSTWIFDDFCEFEHVYNSPLYKALS